MIVKCKQCHQELDVIPSLAKIKKFCSRECRGLAERGSVAKTAIFISCVNCGKEFRTYKCRDVVTCSLRCGGLQRRKRYDVNCLTCGKEVTTKPSEAKKYCSKKCWGLGNRSEKNYLWKGDEASYRTQHKWIERRMGKACYCDSCGIDKVPEGMKRFFHWANVSGEYKRRTDDYISLCAKCHGIFDSKKRHNLCS